MVGIVDGLALRALELDLQRAIRNLVAVLHSGLGKRITRRNY